MGPVRRGVSRKVNRSKGGGIGQQQTMGFAKRRGEEVQASTTFTLNMAGLDDGRQQIIKDSRATSNTGEETMVDMTQNAEGQWVDELPADLREEDSFVYALRDIVGSQ